jgi:hypothetical protein
MASLRLATFALTNPYVLLYSVKGFWICHTQGQVQVKEKDSSLCFDNQTGISYILAFVH